jgi:hypothetical protein
VTVFACRGGAELFEPRCGTGLGVQTVENSLRPCCAVLIAGLGRGAVKHEDGPGVGRISLVQGDRGVESLAVRKPGPESW